jgi:hypothetical protein
MNSFLSKASYNSVKRVSSSAFKACTKAHSMPNVQSNFASQVSTMNSAKKEFFSWAAYSNEKHYTQEELLQIAEDHKKKYSAIRDKVKENISNLTAQVQKKEEIERIKQKENPKLTPKKFLDFIKESLDLSKKGGY